MLKMNRYYFLPQTGCLQEGIFPDDSCRLPELSGSEEKCKDPADISAGSAFAPFTERRGSFAGSAANGIITPGRAARRVGSRRERSIARASCAV